jgi:hypothetical protein
MSDQNLAWIGTISDELTEQGPVSFTYHRLQRQEHLFGHRSALFYTPTENIPAEYIGSSPLDIMLPIATPDWTDLFEIRAYWSPRLWVDLIQRQTGKLRWNPISPARVILGVFAYPRKKVQSRISSRLENDPLPPLSVFIDRMHAGKVSIEGGGTEAVVAENLLYGGQRGLPFCRAIVAKVCLGNVRRHVLGDAGALGDPFDNLLCPARTDEPVLMEGEVGFQQRLGPSEGNGTTLFLDRLP